MYNIFSGPQIGDCNVIEKVAGAKRNRRNFRENEQKASAKDTIILIRPRKILGRNQTGRRAFFATTTCPSQDGRRKRKQEKERTPTTLREYIFSRDPKK